MIESLTGISLQISQLTDVLRSPAFYINWNFWNIVVLTITLVVLIIYTIKTHQLVIQAKETNLRPVILRSWVIDSFDDIWYIVTEWTLIHKSIELKILKNIATNICWYLIRSNKKYILYFGNHISSVGSETKFYEKWWRMDKDTFISAVINDETKYQEVNEPNKIVIIYKDIEWNDYYSVEDNYFNQRSDKWKF